MFEKKKREGNRGGEEKEGGRGGGGGGGGGVTKKKYNMKIRQARGKLPLRIRTFFYQTFQVYHVFCNFILGYICRIATNFETLKD